MRLPLALGGALALVAAAGVLPRDEPHIVHDRRHPAHVARFPPVRRLDSDAEAGLKSIPLRIGLAQQNLDSLEAHLLAVSDPTSPTYGQHWSAQRVASTFAPSRESEDAVRGWLVGAGIAPERVEVAKGRKWVQVDVSVGEAEELLQTEYFVFEDGAIGEWKRLTIPASLAAHVEVITPTVQAKRVGSSIQRRSESTNKAPHPAFDQSAAVQVPSHFPASLANCSTLFTPACYQTLYNFHYTPTSTSKNSFAVVEFTPQTFIPSDLDLFFGNFSPALVGQRPEGVFIDGGVFQNTSLGFENPVKSSFDISYAMALTTPQSVQVLQTGDIIESGSFDNYLDAIDGSFCTFDGGDDTSLDGVYPDPAPGGYDAQDCGTISAPYVVTVSYGDDEVSVSEKTAVRQCNEYGKLGLMGMTFLYPTGDNGVAGNDGFCLNSTGQEDPNGQIFMPLFPASCPYVTAVGGTQLADGKTVLDKDAETTWVGTGGGFSNYFTMPSYQASAVTSFLTNHPPPYTDGQYNNSGKARGFPDMSMNANSVAVIAAARLLAIPGTSASSPTAAALFAMVNDARLGKGKAPIGFVNPVLYGKKMQEAGVWRDITTGNNSNCGTDGFEATVGWDPVTGLGTPDFVKLLDVFLDLP
ncbi:Peptidase S53 domain-containing protein [Mycena chlorophos]|uniref:Peptidase S53 domain-containing protein n=1 Tax=Mycena chlorophos TaxID=658473 RepID=A0A8H6TKC1_MYCCL|nr:Peptidase S53 domain-containing protein [Mycena chlorophos]